MFRQREDGPILGVRNTRRRARGIPLTEPFSLEALVRYVERDVGVPIEIQPYPAGLIAQWTTKNLRLPPALCIAGETSIYVFHRSDLTPTHKQHSLLHELGHIWARHLPSGGGVAEAEIENATLTQAHHRSFYNDDKERAAEAFAYTISARIGLMGARSTSAADPQHQDAVARYGSILEG